MLFSTQTLTEMVPNRFIVDFTHLLKQKPASFFKKKRWFRDSELLLGLKLASLVFAATAIFWQKLVLHQKCTQSYRWKKKCDDYG